MATVKIKFRASSVKSREGTLFFQVIHNRVVRQVSTGYKIFPAEWDSLHTEVVLSDELHSDRRAYLQSLRKHLIQGLSGLRAIISGFESSGLPFTSDAVINAYRRSMCGDGFITFIRNQLIHLVEVGRLSAYEKLKSSLASFLRFYGDDDLPFGKITTSLIEEYECFLRRNGLCQNSISFYMRILRSVYNVAVARGLTSQCYPFKSVFTGIEQTAKRAISLKVIRQLRGLDLSSSPVKEWARDLFLFSFYTRGMSFIDMAFLQKKDLQHGVLIYRRHKTNQKLIVKWEKPMQDILDKYDTGDSPYLLPIIRDAHSDSLHQYRNAVHLVNTKLKQIGAQIGLGIPLTTYVARHGWASIARNQNIPLTIISEALGHESEKTTRIYLASLDSSAVDKANSQILNSL